MTDGGGGGGGYGGGGSGPETIDCEDVGGECVLTSPDADALKGLKKGDCLRVELRKVKGTPVAVAMRGDVRVGVIPGAQYKKLLSCLAMNHKFHAIVQSIKGGMCTVEVGHGKCP